MVGNPMAELSPSFIIADGLPGSKVQLTPALLGPGVLLIMGSWCTVLASGALAPVLPQIRDHFVGTPHLDLMIGFVATMPSLAVALLAIPIGRLADKVGLTRVMLAGLALYGIAGIIPFWLESLVAIIVLRFIVGIGEAAVMIASTALIGLLFAGAERTRWLGLQVALANFLGVGVLLGSGVVGLAGWHAPFLIYSFALVLFVPCLMFVPHPRTARAEPGAKDTGHAQRGLWHLVVESCLLIFIASMAIFSAIVQAGFLLETRGATDSAQLGIGMACAGAGIAIGATVSGTLRRWSTALKVRMAFLLIGGGHVAMMLTGGFVATAAAGGVAGLGCGLVIPALLSRLLGRVPASMLGGVTGIWIAATFVGQFANPPLFILLRDIGGSQAIAMGCFGGFCLLVAALLPMLMRADRAATTDQVAA